MKAALFKIPVFVPTVTVVAVVAYLTLSSDPLDGMKLPLFYGADKAVHFLMFLGVGGCLRFDFGRLRAFSGSRYVAALCFALAVVYGGLIEVAQESMAAGRSGDSVDFLADATGALSGVWLAYRLLFKKGRADG